jgi:hypothetical protein
MGAGMSGAWEKYRGWLIPLGIILLILASGMMKFRMKVLFSRMGPLLLLLGVALIVLARVRLTPKKKKDDE